MGSDETREAQGYSPRETRGTYVYKTGDWTYEELTTQKRELVDNLQEIRDALGFTGFVIVAEMIEEIHRLRSPWWTRVRNALGFRRRPVA